MLGKTVELGTFSVGYSIEEGSNLANYFSSFKKQFEANGMILKPMDQKDGVEALLNGEIVSYLTLSDDKYTLYNEEGIHIDAMIFESSFKGGMHLYDGFKTMMAYMVQNETSYADKIAERIKSFDDKQQTNLIKTERLEVDPVPKAQDYYGIVQIIFIIWFGVSSAVGLAEAERKNKISERIRLTNVKPITLFLGRFISNTAATCLQVGIAIGVSTALLKVNWGEQFLLSASVLLLEVIATSAFGTMLTVMIKSSTIINMFMYVGAFVFGFIGGSFQTYMYNFISEDIVRLSPLYYLNRTLIELSTKGSSNYLGTTLVMLLVITISSIAIALTSLYIRREA
jgi:ABC-2 type transport system permease protein